MIASKSRHAYDIEIQNQYLILYYRDGMGVVLDYSIEAGSGTTEELDKVARDILNSHCLISIVPFM